MTGRVLALLVVGASLAASVHGQRSDLRLPGPLLAGAAGGGRAWLLVGAEEAPRQLLELRLDAGGAHLATIAGELPAGTDSLVVAPAGGAARLYLREGSRLRAVTSDGALVDVSHGPGALVAGGARGVFSLPPPWLAAARAGEVRALQADASALREGAAVGIPVKATLERWGLHLKSPSATFIGEWLAVGPLQEGVHLRTVLVGAGGERRELTSVLPEPEQVADSAMVVLDGRPTLVTGTFRGLGVMSRKQLRVFALVGEAGSAPRRPLLTRELTARAWQNMAVRAGDFDGDGRDDLAIAAADGLGGGEVVVTLFRGMGGGRLRAEPLTASFPMKKRSWRYGADVDGDRRPDLVTLGAGRLEVHRAGVTGLPEKKPSQVVKLEGTEAESRTRVEVSIGSDGAQAETNPPEESSAADEEGEDGEDSRPDADWEVLDLDADAKAELLWWVADAKGKSARLVVLRF